MRYFMGVKPHTGPRQHGETRGNLEVSSMCDLPTQKIRHAQIAPRFCSPSEWPQTAHGKASGAGVKAYKASWPRGAVLKVVPGAENL